MPEFENPIVIKGLTGATAATRWVGATASGAPASGTFALGDFITTQNGHIFICTVAGSPGTWADVTASIVAGSTSLSGDSDVTLTSSTNLDALIYNGASSKWTNQKGLGVLTSGYDLLIGGTSATVNKALSPATAVANGGASVPNIIDGNDSTYTFSANGTPAWYMVDLQSATIINSFRVLQSSSVGNATSVYSLQSSPDNSTWTDQKIYSSAAPTDTGELTLANNPVTARYWRIYAASGVSNWQISSFELRAGTLPGVQTRLALSTTADDLLFSNGTALAYGKPTKLSPTGMTGATAASRYVGATTSGAPASGTFAVGDFIIDQTGTVWICTTAGTPGRWANLLTNAPATNLYLRDEFMSGSASNGVLGELGWIFSGGTTTIANGEADHPGIYNRATSATSGTIAPLTLRSAGNGGFIPSASFTSTFVIRLNTNDANTTARIGHAVNFGNNGPNDGMYFEKLDADTNWFCVSRASSTQTRTDSTVAVGTGWVVMLLRRKDASTLGFKLGATFALAQAATEITQTTNPPVIAMNSGLHIVNSAAANKSIDIDFFDFGITGMAR